MTSQKMYTILTMKSTRTMLESLNSGVSQPDPHPCYSCRYDSSRTTNLYSWPRRTQIGHVGTLKGEAEGQQEEAFESSDYGGYYGQYSISLCLQFVRADQSDFQPQFLIFLSIDHMNV